MTEKLDKVREAFSELRGLFEVVPLQPKIFINTFPKSGTHLANLICQHLAHKQEPMHWLGTFTGNSWTTQWKDLDPILTVIKGQPAGTWYQGHMGHHPLLEDAFYRQRVAMLFVYRDLRDVAVSQAYHIEVADGENKFHPGRDKFMDLPDHAARIKAVIEGLDEYSGIIERWKLFHPWLYSRWVLHIKYEEMIHNPKEVAERAVSYVIRRTLGEDAGSSIVLERDVVEAILHSNKMLQTTDYSSSYRKGVSGEWRNEFTPELIQAFKKADDENFLVRLGYEQDENW